MNRHELVVRELLAALAVPARVKLNAPFDRHTYIDTRVGDLDITFWTRNEITRVASVRFPDGTFIDYEAEEDTPDPWIPPRDEFPEWWQLMGEEARPEQALIDEATAMHHRVREATKSGMTDEERRELQNALYLAFIRPRLYNAWNYLTDGEQADFEMLLRKFNSEFGGQ